MPSFIYRDTPSPHKHWHASLVSTSPHQAPGPAHLLLPGAGCGTPAVTAQILLHILALARLHCRPEQGADSLENLSFLSFFAGLFFGQGSSVVMQSCQLKANDGNWPTRQGCCFLPAYGLCAANHEMSPLCVLPSLVSQI